MTIIHDYTIPINSPAIVPQQQIELCGIVSEHSRHSRLGGPLANNTAPVTSLQFSPDGTMLLSASSDGAVRLLQVPAHYPDAARDALCAKLTHNPTEGQWNEWVPKGIDIPYKDACTNLPRSEYAYAPR